MKPISLSAQLCLLFFFLGLIFLFSAFQSKEVQTTAHLQSNLEQDTVQARTFIETAEMLRESASYDSAIVYYQKAAKLYRPYLKENSDTALWKVYLKCNNQIGGCYEDLGDRKKSLNLFLTTLEQGRKNLGENHPYVAVSYNNIGSVYSKQGAYEIALENFQKALKIKIDALVENHPSIAVTYNNIGLIFRRQGFYQAALNNHQKALKIRIYAHGENHPDVVSSYNNIGIAYELQGSDQAALENYQKALKIQIKASGENHLVIRSGYRNIGSVYNDIGAYATALGNFQKGLRMSMDILGENHPIVAEDYESIGTIFKNLGSDEIALENYQRALKIRMDALGKNHPEVYENVALVRTLQEAYRLALENYQKALKIRLKTLGKNHPNLAKSYYNLGQVYYLQGEGKTALENHYKALNIRMNAFGEKHPEVIKSYNDIGMTYSREGRYDKALESFQRALVANTNNFDSENINLNPELNDDVISEIELLKTLKQKARTLFILYQMPRQDFTDFHLSYQTYHHELGVSDPYLQFRFTNLQLSFQTYQLAGQLIDRMRRNFKRQEDKIELSKEAFDIFEQTIATSFEFYQQTEQDSFLNHAFSFFEKSRSMLLLEALQETNAKKFGVLPDTLLEKEYNLETRLAFYEKSLFEEELKKEAADSNKIALWQDYVFNLKQSLDSITTYLEAEYPEYYRLKYDADVASISDVQAMLPDTETALIEYFAGDSSLYAFVIGKNDYQLIEIPQNNPLEAQIAQFVKNLNSPNPNQYQNRKDSLANQAYELYQQIFAPIERQYELPEKLIIIPDGALGYLPFEALLQVKPDPAADYPQFDFLIKHYQISYCFSATLLQEMQERKHPKTKGRLLAFAPEFKAPSTIADSTYAQMVFQDRLVSDTRSGLLPLLHNIPEVKAAGNITGGASKLFIGAQATRDNFLTNCSNYQILHLSSHAEANDKVGDYSWIAFHQKDSADNEFLYNRDLYNLQLKADLVVLSACETGGGELQRGEGIVGLTRGFSYAGAKSLVASLWQVNDQSTRGLMQDFYRGIKAGQSKDDALRQAKLNQLGNRDYADPFYWAAFVPIGDMSPIDLSGGANWGLWGGLGVLAIAAGLFFFFRRP